MATRRTPQDQEPAGRQRTRRSPAPHERQRDAERTKARILDAAVEVFSAKGFDRARVTDIAERAGVNQQLISYYFNGKRGLFREIGRRWRAYEAETIRIGLRGQRSRGLPTPGPRPVRHRHGFPRAGRTLRRTTCPGDQLPGAVPPSVPDSRK
ncbi:TetR family transcriptional regulator [Nonomuraea sp. NPDC049141]|uniref:TetR family transcriptional regulator n=1 Tax=unclassified Nonomuraea TaxID=2593643 RepID=UPI0033F673FF